MSAVILHPTDWLAELRSHIAPLHEVPNSDHDPFYSGWPMNYYEGLAQIRKVVLGNAVESFWYALINVVLTHLFPSDSGFLVLPQPVPARDHREATDSMIFWIRMVASSPKREGRGYVIVVWEAKPEWAYGSFSGEMEADNQMRTRLLDVSRTWDQEAPLIIGISSFGPRFHVYTKFRGKHIQPPRRSNDAMYESEDVWPGSHHQFIIHRESGHKALELVRDICLEILQHEMGPVVLEHVHALIQSLKASEGDERERT
ncbi:hypothetical protein DACRYDRAFT_111359 [Dacryopinax primogenitus]|uniref:Uncharacterized protein n=1 Tax=Dacryopinax primogenitus (strain DJM 731) TaxID=1858805 RepID=M5FWN5_DACPD|nr:uncharacterized protein DACRYDRAFT_111359 [Dacryopinax primogenitus]EJT97841.1 hypothetical protein DACRYDRAFT_111359 [Dacryopinax primogenitus]